MRSRKKILFLIPPADKLYIRDYYCSFSSKANYYWPPQDLIILSGILNNKFFVDVVDAMALGLNYFDCLRMILRKNIDVIIFSTGSATLRKDVEFLGFVKSQKPSLKIIASSAIFHFIGKEIMEQFIFLDGVLLDFTNCDAVHFIEGNYNDIENMLFRKESEVIERRYCTDSPFVVPLPRHNLFLNKKCKLPFFKNRHFITTITSVGCPYKCFFCCAGSIKYKFRSIDNLLEEIEYIYHHLGISNLFFADPVLFVNKERAIQLFEEIIKKKMVNLSWICNIRADSLEEGLVELMKKAGCKAILVGVESGNQEILDKYHKNINLEYTQKVFDWCRKHKVYTLAYFILGLPGEDKASLQDTSKFIKGLKCDFISISFAMPDIGTYLREIALKDHLCSQDFLDNWDPSAFPYLSNSLVSREELMDFRKDIYRSFYLKPRWFFREFGNVNLGDLIRGGIAILKR